MEIEQQNISEIKKDKKNLNEAQRWQIIGFLQGYQEACGDINFNKDAKFVIIGRTTVSALWKKFKELNDVKSKKRKGRSPEITKECEDKVVSEITKDYNSTRMISEKLYISHMSVFNIAKKYELKFKKKIEKEKITCSILEKGKILL